MMKGENIFKKKPLSPRPIVQCLVTNSLMSWDKICTQNEQLYCISGPGGGGGGGGGGGVISGHFPRKYKYLVGTPFKEKQS